MTKVSILCLSLLLVSQAFCATHVFWHLATTKGYALTAVSPGPGLAAGATVHEGRIVTTAMREEASSLAPAFFVGNGQSGAQGRHSVVWFRELCDLTGTCTSAKIRGEFRDGYCGDNLCYGGLISMRRGVVDFQGTIDFYGGIDLVVEGAQYNDAANPLLSTIGFSGTETDSMRSQDTLSYIAPMGRTSDIDPSVLDGQFAEIDVTPQVNWILAHTGQNKGSFSGQYAVALVTTPGAGDTGKINLYSDVDAVGPGTGCISDQAWTQDCNTLHLVVEGDLSPVEIAVERNAAKPAKASLFLAQSSPNPFTASTAIAYSAGDRGGMLRIYSPTGRLVYETSVHGSGAIKWDANGLTSGIYAARLTIGSTVFSKRLVLMK